MARQTRGNKNVQIIDKTSFNQALRFIAADIGRELELAKVPCEQLRAIGVTPGGGNFLAALGLACYTEFAGRMKYRYAKASENFNRFFDDLGPAYAEARRRHKNVYDVVRCGLAHEYFVKQNCEINMFGKVAAGVAVRVDGTYVITVEAYFRDFMKAFEELGRTMFPQRGASA